MENAFCFEAGICNETSIVPKLRQNQEIRQRVVDMLSNMLCLTKRHFFTSTMSEFYQRKLYKNHSADLCSNLTLIGLFGKMPRFCNFFYLYLSEVAENFPFLTLLLRLEPGMGLKTWTIPRATVNNMEHGRCTRKKFGLITSKSLFPKKQCFIF